VSGTFTRRCISISSRSFVAIFAGIPIIGTMQNYRSIIICANPRSGSTLLCDLLESTGVAGRPTSFYRQQSISDWARQLDVGPSEKMERLEFERAYLAAIHKEGTGGTGIFGLRLMWDTVEGLVERLGMIYPDAPGDFALFERAFGRPLYLSLTRQDKVAQAVSLVKASQSGLWHLASDGSERQRSKEHEHPAYDADAIGAEVTSLTKDDVAWQEWFAQQGISPLCISYEDLATNPKAMLAKILAALGRDPNIAMSIEPATARMADEETDRWIERYRNERVDNRGGR
jgi:trehalose 2-sulfotransferase